MDHETVLIFIEKLNAAKEIIKTTEPHELTFSTTIQNIIKIEEILRQSRLIQLGEQWVYPNTGWISSGIINFTDAGFKVLSEDFTVRTIDGRIINSFSYHDIDALRRDMFEYKLFLPRLRQTGTMSAHSYAIGFEENKTYMYQGGSWINRGKTTDTPGRLDPRHSAERIPTDNNKDYYRVRFCIAN